MPAPPLIPNTHSLHTRVYHLRLHCLQSGNPANPTVILLHGFPDFSYSWRYQIPALTAAGFHVLAPDLRGYNLSDKPPRVSDYRVEILAADVSSLISTYTPGRATLVGHDWGGVIAFHAAMRFPNLLSKLVILNAPHPVAYRRELLRGQLLRSYYALLFQLPWLPEFILQANDSYLLRRILRQGPARASHQPDQDVRHYLTAFSHPRAIRSAINYYRAALRPRSPLFHHIPIIHTPTLLLWGDRDPYLQRQLTENLDPWLPNLRTVHFPNASHWVHHDAPDRVNSLLLEFLNS